jgi:hypothetical protein
MKLKIFIKIMNSNFDSEHYKEEIKKQVHRKNTIFLQDLQT